MPQAGYFDQRISVYAKNVIGQNSFGEDVLGPPILMLWTWASVDYLQGRELERVMQRWADARYKIRMRRNPVEIKREHWIEWHDQRIDILDVGNMGTREPEWIILAKDHVE